MEVIGHTAVSKCIYTLPLVPGEEVLHHFQMSREESKRLKDIEGRLLAIREENERMQQEPVVSKSSTNMP